jgi:hypothetical protein
MNMLISPKTHSPWEYFKFKLLALGSGLGDNFAAAALTLCASDGAHGFGSAAGRA